MRELFRTLPLMCLVLLVPILPFLLLNDQVEAWLGDVAEHPPSPAATFSLVVGLLLADLLLPIPSSVISTLSGWRLGWFWGTLATWLGMTLGALLGFSLAYRFGRSFALWFSGEQDLERMRRVNERYGPTVLVLTRAIPVFAEAAVLMAGIHRLSWRRFLPAILLSNLGIAVAYAGFGKWAAEHQWLPLALGVAVALPILFAAVAHRWFPAREEE